MQFLPCDRSGCIPIQIIELPKCTLGQSALEEAILAVRSIVRNYPAPYTLMLSGGVDSQAMLYAWLKSGETFRTLTFRYQGMNDHDIITLQEFIELNDLDVSLQYMDFDVMSFLNTDYPNYATKYECSSPQICTHMKCSEMIHSGTVIFSGNFVMSPRNSGPMLSYAILGMKRYAERSGRSIVPFFFLHTPQLAYSFIPYEMTDALSGYEMKVEMYRLAGFPVIQQGDKYTGFERVKELCDGVKIPITTRLKYASKPSSRPFDLLYRYPYEQKINDPRIDYIYTFFQDPL